MAKNKILSKIAKYIKSLVSDETEQEEQEEKNDPYVDFDTANDCLKAAFKNLNIRAQEHIEEDSTTYTFTFQTAFFLIDIYNTRHRTFRLAFPGVASYPINELNNIRYICNSINGDYIQINASYHLSEENKLDVNLTCHLPCMTHVQDMVYALTLALNDCFVVRRLLHKGMSDLQEMSENNSHSDLEYAQMQSIHLNNLLAETEIYKRHDKENFDPDNVVEAIDMYVLSTWLKTYSLLPPTFNKWIKMECEGDDGYHFSTQDSEVINSYCIVEPIVHQIGKEEEPKARTGVIKLTYLRTSGDKEQVYRQPHLLIIALEKIFAKDNIVYIRINAMMPERRAVNDRVFNALTQDELLTARSMVIAVDAIEGKSRYTEMAYMWKDAIDKKREKKTYEWTKEQRLIHSILSPNTAYDLYWGQKFLNEKRYYEASLHLHRAWSCMNSKYAFLNKEELDTFKELCFLLGVAYLKMDLYPQAYFYLHDLQNEGNVKYCAEFIKTLMAANDHRAYDITQTHIYSIQMLIEKNRDDEREVDERIYHFLDFLKRCYVLLSIDRHYLNDAEKDCQEMIEENHNIEFAQKELERIQSMRESGIENRERPTMDLMF